MAALILSITASAAATVTTGVSTPIPAISLSEPGNVAGETFTATVSDGGAGLLSVTGAGVAGVTGSGTDSLIISGSLDQVNTDLAALTDTENPGSDSITITADDNLGNTAGPSLIDVTSNPLVLSIAAPPTVTATTGVATPIPDVSLSEPGSIAGETFTARVIAHAIGPGSGLVTASGSDVSGSGTGELTVTGSLADVNAALATLSVSESAAGTDTLDIVATDSLGDNPPISAVNVVVTAQTLSIIAPTMLTVTRDQATPIAGASLSEPGSITGETFSARVIANAIGPGSGLVTASGSDVSGSGTGDLRVNGSLAEVNAALATLSVSESAAGTDTLDIVATDSLGGNPPIFAVTVTVAAPTLSILAPSTSTVTAGVATAIAGVSLSEPGSIAGETFTAVLTDTTGVLTATGPVVSGSGTAGLTVTGLMAQVDSARATLSDTESAVGSTTIVVNATDSLGDSAGPVDIAVSALGPVIDAPPTLTLTFDQAAAIPGVSLTDTANVANETYTVTLSDAHGLLSATGDNVAGDATTALTITGSLTDVNAALATLFDRSDTPGSDTIAISATDSAGIPVRPADVAVTTTPPVLPVEGVSEEDPSRLATGFGSITDSASGQLGSRRVPRPQRAGLIRR